MMCKFACLFIKGDWAEFAHTLGLPNWRDGYRPCFCCSGFGNDRFVAAGNSSERLRWDESSAADYDDACTRCEIKVRIVSTSVRDNIWSSLRFDRKPRGGSGLALHVPLPELGLVVGDRLEPSDSLHDVGKLRDAEVPLDVVFWRRSEESLCRHRNPLLTADVGLSTDKALTVDTLHALYLGVMLVYCRVTVWVVLHSGVYGHGVGGEAGLVPAVLAIRHALFGFYDRRHAALPEENLTRVSDMVPAMLGTSADPKLKTKGAETWGFLFFCWTNYGDGALNLEQRWTACCGLAKLWCRWCCSGVAAGGSCLTTSSRTSKVCVATQSSGFRILASP